MRMKSHEPKIDGSNTPKSASSASRKKEIGELIRRLKGPNWRVREEAAESLEKIRDSQAVEPLIELLECHKRWKYRDWEERGLERREEQFICSKAVKCLGVIGDLRAVEPLIEALKSEHIRAEAAEALGELGDLRAVEPLAELLEDERSTVRCNAADALGKIGDIKAIKPLLEAGRNSWSSLYGHSEKAVVMMGKQAIPELISLLCSVDGVYISNEYDAELAEALAEMEKIDSEVVPKNVVRELVKLFHGDPYDITELLIELQLISSENDPKQVAESLERVVSSISTVIHIAMDEIEEIGE